MVKVKNFKKWIFPIFLFIFFEFCYSKKVRGLLPKYGFKDFALIYFVANSLMAIVFIIIIYFVFKNKLNSIDSSKKISLLKSVLISIITFIITFFVIERIIGIIIYYIFGQVNSHNGNLLEVSQKSSIFAVFEVVLAGPILEEIVYRRILFGYLYDLHSGCNKYVRFITSVVVSSIIFGSTHNGVFHPYMLYYVTTGVVCASVYLYTKRISSAIIIHCLTNGIIYLMRIMG